MTDRRMTIKDQYDIKEPVMLKKLELIHNDLLEFKTMIEAIKNAPTYLQNTMNDLSGSISLLTQEIKMSAQAQQNSVPIKVVFIIIMAIFVGFLGGSTAKAYFDLVHSFLKP